MGSVRKHFLIIWNVLSLEAFCMQNGILLLMPAFLLDNHFLAVEVKETQKIDKQYLTKKLDIFPWLCNFDKR